MSKKNVESHLVKWVQTTYNTVSNSGIKSSSVGPKQHGSTQCHGYEPWLTANKSWQLCLPQGPTYVVCLWFSVIYGTCCFTVFALLKIIIPTLAHKSTRGMYIVRGHQITSSGAPHWEHWFQFYKYHEMVLPAPKECKHWINTHQWFKHINRNGLICAQRSKIKTSLLWPATYVPVKAEECGYL